MSSFNSRQQADQQHIQVGRYGPEGFTPRPAHTSDNPMNRDTKYQVYNDFVNCDSRRSCLVCWPTSTDWSMSKPEMLHFLDELVYNISTATAGSRKGTAA